MKPTFVSKRHIYVLSVVLFLVLPSIFPSFYDPSSFAQSIPLEDFRTQVHVKKGFFIFWSDSVYSKSFMNPLNETVTFNVEEGVLCLSIETGDISNVTVFDNLGNHFNPVVLEKTVKNPTIQVDIPPLFTYRLSLFFESVSVFSMIGSVTFYNFSIVPASPVEFRIVFPSDFTILNFTQGATMTKNDDFIELNWLLEKDVYANMLVGFLPFTATVTDISRWIILDIRRGYDVNVDISSVFPSQGYFEVSAEDVFEVPAMIGEWKIDVRQTKEISFPGNATDALVERVWDGVGDCTEVTSPVKNITAEKLGRYYVDYINRKVLIYPRWHFKEEYYFFKVGVLFRVPAETSGRGMVQEIPFIFLFLPIPRISYSSHIITRQSLVPASAIRNITSYTEVKFVLPENTVPDLSRSAPNARQGLDKGRPVVYWVVNASGDVEMGDYTVVYDVRPLKDAFIFGFSLLSLELLVTLVVLFLRKRFDDRTSWTQSLVTSFPASYIVIVFNTYGGVPTLSQLPILSILFTQITISLIPVISLIHSYRKKRERTEYIA